jgi:hypothetical protein
MALCSNFAFLEEHDPVFLQLAGTAEQVFASDPNPPNCVRNLSRTEGSLLCDRARAAPAL